MATPNNEPSFKPMGRSTVTLVVCGLLLTAIVSVWLLLQWFGSGQPGDQARLDTLRLAGQIVLGTGGLAALWVTLRRQRSTELTLQHQREVAATSQADATEQRITELYFKAADQLGSEKAPVRLAGLYALERLANDNPSQRPNIIALLCGYLRMAPLADGAGSTSNGHEAQVRTTVQHILKRRLHRNEPEGPEWAGAVLDLRGASLDHLDLCEISARSLDLTGATINGAVSLKNAHLSDDLLMPSVVSSAGIDASSVTIGGTLNLSNGAFRSSVDFVHAQVRGSVIAHSAEFGEEVDFQAIAVDGDADFKGAAFAAVCSFGGGVYAGLTDFSKAKFGGYTSFKNTRFRHYAVFGRAEFGSMANFSGCRIGGKGRFNVASFAGLLDFSDAEIKNNAEFNKVRFQDEADFSGTTFGATAWFSECVFGGAALFNSTRYTNSVNFGNATFAQLADFANSIFYSSAYFAKSANVDLQDVLSFGPRRNSWPDTWVAVEETPQRGEEVSRRLVQRPIADQP